MAKFICVTTDYAIAVSKAAFIKITSTLFIKTNINFSFLQILM